MSKITPCLWFDGQAEEAANFYVSVFPDSRVDEVMRSPADTPSGPEGSVLLVRVHDWRPVVHGAQRRARVSLQRGVSFMVDCADQAEVDRLWEALSADAEAEQCGWLKDRFGLSWQIIPSALPKLLADSDPAKARRAMEAMLEMKKIDVATLERAREGELSGRAAS